MFNTFCFWTPEGEPVHDIKEDMAKILSGSKLLIVYRGYEDWITIIQIKVIKEKVYLATSTTSYM